MDLPIIYEDESLVVIDKPPGLVVNQSESAGVNTVQEWAKAKLKDTLVLPHWEASEKGQNFYNRAGIVHRLDKDTSGILLIARTPPVFSKLQSQFFERTVSKKYLALVMGRVSPERGTVRAPIGRLPWKRTRFGVLPDGREAETTFAVVDYYKKEKNMFTLLSVTPFTGRTHQIRVHLSYLGHPIVGDALYGGRKREERALFSPRQFLHASYLRFTHPKKEKEMEFTSPLPSDLQTVLASLEHIPEVPTEASGL